MGHVKVLIYCCYPVTGCLQSVACLYTIGVIAVQNTWAPGLLGLANRGARA